VKLVVTGASGKAGRAVVRDLAEHEHEVLGVDVVSGTDAPATFLLADLTDFGQTVECLASAEAVVHLAAIPAPGIHTEAATTVMNRPSSELMAEVYAAVSCRPTTGDFATLLSIEKARKLLGYQPVWSWRDHISS
jgi:nucleoside-diphosphate-sugar epimerase